jgi:hypothetical protein
VCVCNGVFLAAGFVCVRAAVRARACVLACSSQQGSGCMVRCGAQLHWATHGAVVAPRIDAVTHSCAGLHRMLKGTPVERLKLLFDILDSDSDGYITYSEVFRRGGRSVQPSMDTCLPACMHA